MPRGLYRVEIKDFSEGEIKINFKRVGWTIAGDKLVRTLKQDLLPTLLTCNLLLF